MAKVKRSNARTKNGIRIADVELADGRKVLEVDFTIRVGGELVRKRLRPKFKSRRQAQAWGETERDALVKSGGKRSSEPARANPEEPRTVRYWAARWLEDATNPASRAGANRPGTVKSKEQIARLHLLPVLGARAVTRIDEDVVDGYVRAKLAEKKAETTIALHLSLLGTILRFAKRKGVGAERALELPDNIKLKKPKRAKEPQTLSNAQTAKVLAAAKLRSKRLYALAALLFRQGMRIGEVSALRWSDVDFEAGIIDVARSWDKDFGFGPTKGGEPRRIDLHPQTREALAAIQRSASDAWSLIFPHAKDPARPPDGLGERLRPVVDGLGLRDDEGKPLRFCTKMGRHTVGRHCAEEGLPPRFTQELLGHSALWVTEIYSHWGPREGAKHIAKLGGWSQSVDANAVAERLRGMGVDEATIAAAGLPKRTTRAAKPRAKGKRQR